MSVQLGKADWIAEGLRTLARSGIEAVRVEPIAKALNVTKGSFYWHFPARPALLSAMLEAWSARATSAIIDTVEAAGGPPEARLRALFTAVSSTSGRLERAIRAWAAHDDEARLAMEQVDARRLAYLMQLFGEIGFAGPDAVARSRFCYHALVGQFTLGCPLSVEERTRERVEIILPMLVRRS